jgi:L-xylulose reductase
VNIILCGYKTGIGRDLCIHLAKSSPQVKVFALSQTQANLDSLKKECPTVEIVRVDVSNWEETRKAVEGLLPIHVLVNNAATAVLAPFLEATPQEFDTYENAEKLH